MEWKGYGSLLLKRLGMMLVALFMIILLTFVIEHSIPGGAIYKRPKGYAGGRGSAE